MPGISREEIVQQRLVNQGLAFNAFDDVGKLLSASLGIQSQYMNHALFNIFSRVEVSVTDVVSHTLDPAILAWGQRQTYHFYDYATWQNMCHFLGTKTVWIEKYFDSNELDLTTVCSELQHKLRSPVLRSELVKQYGEQWKVLFHWSALFVYASRQGKLYHKWCPNDRLVAWQNEPYAVGDDAVQNMVERYFNFYGPATLGDAAHFFGVPQSKIKQASLDKLHTFEYAGKQFFVTEWHDAVIIPEVILLGKFDPLLVGYQYKDILIPSEKKSSVWKKAGQISSVVLVHGEMCGTWTMKDSGQSISFEIVTDKQLLKSQQAYIQRLLNQYCMWQQKVVKHIIFEVNR